jgi:hypothetical protein
MVGGARRGKGGVLGKEAVAGMDCLGAASTRGVENALDAEI